MQCIKCKKKSFRKWKHFSLLVNIKATPNVLRGVVDGLKQSFNPSAVPVTFLY